MDTIIKMSYEIWRENTLLSTNSEYIEISGMNKEKVANSQDLSQLQ